MKYRILLLIACVSSGASCERTRAPIGSRAGYPEHVMVQFFPRRLLGQHEVNPPPDSEWSQNDDSDTVQVAAFGLPSRFVGRVREEVFVSPIPKEAGGGGDNRPGSYVTVSERALSIENLTRWAGGYVVTVLSPGALFARYAVPDVKAPTGVRITLFDQHGDPLASSSLLLLWD